MNDGLSYSHFEIDNLAEGMQEISESVELTSFLRTTAIPIVHSELGVKELSAEEAMVSQVSVKLEGRDDSDAQDASLTMDEGKPAHHPQTISHVSEFAPI